MLYVQLTGGTEQIWACVSSCDHSAWTANQRRTSKWCTYLQAQMCGCSCT